MPYIDPNDRKRYDDKIAVLTEQLSYTDFEAGHVNYVFSRLLFEWWSSRRRYFTICLIMGTLICVAFEFYRKIAAPYEDKKCEENGEVYF